MLQSKHAKDRQKALQGVSSNKSLSKNRSFIIGRSADSGESINERDSKWDNSNFYFSN